MQSISDLVVVVVFVIAILIMIIDHHRQNALHGGVEVAGLTVDREIRVRFSAYPHRVRAL